MDLIEAAKNSDIENVRLLLESGTEVNIQDRVGWTALMWASRNGNTDIVRLLLEHGVEVNIQDNYSWTALISASMYGHTEIIRLLLEHGVNVNIHNNKGNTALILASIHDHTEIERLLLDNNADPNIKNNDGYTALIYASIHGHTEIIRLLLEHGANPNIQDMYGITPLIWASGYEGDNTDHLEGRLQESVAGADIVELLLENGANPSIQDNIGNTAITEASKHNNDDIVELLINNGVDPNYETKYNRVKRIQRRFREKRTLKRNMAAKSIQSRYRGKLTRKRDLLSKYGRYKQWSNIEAFDSIIYEGEDMYNYLRENDRNFILQIPNGSYEAWNVDDILQLNSVGGTFNYFYECLQANQSMRRENINQDISYIKLGTSNYVVKLPRWLNTGRPDMPEPRIFTLKKYKIVQALVSNNILNHRASTHSGDHCNHIEPLQTYTLEVVEEEELIKAGQRLNLSRVLEQSGIPSKLHDMISQKHRTMRHDAGVLERQRAQIRENELMAEYTDYLDELTDGIKLEDPLDRQIHGEIPSWSETSSEDSFDRRMREELDDIQYSDLP